LVINFPKPRNLRFTSRFYNIHKLSAITAMPMTTPTMQVLFVKGAREPGLFREAQFSDVFVQTSKLSP